MGFVKNTNLPTIFSIVFLSLILATSQSQAVFAGVADNDFDGYPSEYTCGGVNCDPDDKDPCNPDPDTQACFDRFREIVKEVGDIMVEVDEMATAGDFDINHGQLNAIISNLETASKKIETENINAAINSMNAFINKINAHMNAGHISTLDGKELILAAQDIIRILELNS